MNKYLLPCLALFFLFSCEDDTEQESYEMNISTTKKAKKIDVCHKGKIINVSINAIAAHQAHGDAVDMDGDGYFDIDNPCSETDCVDTAELEVQVDPDGTPGNGDEYTLYVYPDDNHPSIIWANIRRTTGAADLWDGNSNTDDIVMDQGAGLSYAAGLCASLKDDGCDWYLPSKNELNAMYHQHGPNGSGLIVNGETTFGAYWSSTEKDEPISLNAWRQDFSTGIGSHITKFAGVRCRCVRR